MYRILVSILTVFIQEASMQENWQETDNCCFNKTVNTGEYRSTPFFFGDTSNGSMYPSTTRRQRYASSSSGENKEIAEMYTEGLSVNNCVVTLITILFSKRRTEARNSGVRPISNPFTCNTVNRIMNRDFLVHDLSERIWFFRNWISSGEAE